MPLVVAAKGLERRTGKRMTEVIAEVAPEAVPAVLSGPSFATDVARGLPTAVTIAAEDEAVALSLCHALGGATFRPYAETDVTGVEIGGAVKNVLAIAAGIVAGRGLGASALAAMVARGFAELRRLGEALGAKPETLMGLSGLGDLVLTCSSPQSRNFAYGRRLGEGGDVAAPTAARRGDRDGLRHPRPRPQAACADADRRRGGGGAVAEAHHRRGHRGADGAADPARGGVGATGAVRSGAWWLRPGTEFDAVGELAEEGRADDAVDQAVVDGQRQMDSGGHHRRRRHAPRPPHARGRRQAPTTGRDR